MRLPSLVRMAAIVVLVAAGAFMLSPLERRFVYFPLGRAGSPQDAGLSDADAVTFATEDGLSLTGWFVPARRPLGPATVIVFNGNAGNRAMRAPLAARLADRGIASFLFDYRGYSGNAGMPSEAGLAADARAAYRYVEQRPDVDAGRIAYFGESLGSAVAVALASIEPPFRLILRSPFTSLVDVGRHHYPILPVGRVLRDRFDTLHTMESVRVPTLVIAGTDDRVIPLALTKRLYETVPGAKRLLLIDGADHNDYALLAGPELVDAVVRFLSEG